VLQAIDGAVSQGAWQGATAQRWVFEPAEAGFLKIRGGDQCMAIENNAVVPGAVAILGSCDAATSQWRIETLADGNLKIVNRESEQSLDLAHCGLAEGTGIAQAPWLDNDCQKFQLREIPAES
jgi:hypothetical protein